MSPPPAPFVSVRPLQWPVGSYTQPGSEVHVWDASSDRPIVPYDELLGVLSGVERERYDRMGHRPAAERFAHARGLLRHQLAGYLGCRPADVPLTVTADGKPEVAGGPHFNLSHTTGRLVLAVSDSPVGVDVEPVRAVPSADDLVRRWFHPAEAEQYFNLPTDQRPAAFLRGWTCKEALLKGIGCGSRELAGCVVELAPDRSPAVRLSPDGLVWRLHCWQPDAGFVAATAMLAGSSPTR